MQINKVNSITFKQNETSKNPKPKLNLAKITGYGCLTSGMGSIIAAKTKNLNLHKNLAYIAGALAIIHTGIIEYYHHKFKK
jgi:hydroxyethylthiazole kinase-like sugar kinase family protein